MHTHTIEKNKLNYLFKNVYSLLSYTYLYLLSIKHRWIFCRNYAYQLPQNNSLKI